MRKNPKIYVEGASKKDKALRIALQSALASLLKKAGIKGHIPIKACGSRNDAFEDFSINFSNASEFSVLLVDAEDPAENLTDDLASDFAWQHLEKRDGWKKPKGAHNRQALLMATCMESWIAADRAALREFFGPEMQESALPKLENLENQNRKEVHDALLHATRDCQNPFKKGTTSFKIFGELEPKTLENLSQFRRLKKAMDTF